MSVPNNLPTEVKKSIEALQAYVSIEPKLKNKLKGVKEMLKPHRAIIREYMQKNNIQKFEAAGRVFQQQLAILWDSGSNRKTFQRRR